MLYRVAAFQLGLGPTLVSTIEQFVVFPKLCERAMRPLRADECLKVR